MNLGFPCGLAGKEFTCNARDLCSILGLGRSLKEPTPVFWAGEFHGLYSPWGHKELDMTEQLSLSLFIAKERSVACYLSTALGGALK